MELAHVGSAERSHIQVAHSIVSGTPHIDLRGFDPDAWNVAQVTRRDN